MKHVILILGTAAFAPWMALAEGPSEPGEDALFEILRDTTGGPPVRVSVVLEDEGKPVTTESKPTPTSSSSAISAAGKPPVKEELVSLAAAPAVRGDTEKGVAVRVETLQQGTAPIDPKQVKLLAPFPAKPLSDPPRGWVLDASTQLAPFIKEVEIAPGTRISLSIRPHLLAPVVNGADYFSVSEPGFDPLLAYQQTQTVGAILATSIEQLDEDSKQLGGVIDRLQQLLVSLPSTANEIPAAIPVASPALQAIPSPRKR